MGTLFGPGEMSRTPCSTPANQPSRRTFGNGGPKFSAPPAETGDPPPPRHHKAAADQDLRQQSVAVSFSHAHYHAIWRATKAD